MKRVEGESEPSDNEKDGSESLADSGAEEGKMSLECPAGWNEETPLIERQPKIKDGLLNMKFMKRAVEKRKAEAIADAEAESDENSGSVGRRVFGAETARNKPSVDEDGGHSSDDLEDKELRPQKTPAAAGKANLNGASPLLLKQPDFSKPSDLIIGIQRSGPRQVVIEQQELLQAAFADDDVFEKDFEEEKNALVEKSVEIAKEIILPGWGSWAGEGVKPRAPRENPALQAKQERQRAVALASRKDAKLKHVIINEKLSKKSTKLFAKAIPFPYQTSEQYELAFRQPLGKEWTTSTVHRKMVQPQTVLKAGRVIDPLQLPEEDEGELVA